MANFQVRGLLSIVQFVLKDLIFASFIMNLSLFYKNTILIDITNQSLHYN